LVENGQLLPTLPVLGAPLGLPRSNFAEILGIRKQKFLAVVWHCLGDHKSSYFGFVTDRHRALAWHCAVHTCATHCQQFSSRRSV